eukprot:7581203-Pyramimonas_sp.AAC.2
MATAVDPRELVTELSRVLENGVLSSLLKQFRARLSPHHEFFTLETSTDGSPFKELVAEVEKRVARLDGIIDRYSRCGNYIHT